jgi:hypothetical protein
VRGRRTFTVSGFGGAIPTGVTDLSAQPSAYDLPTGAAYVADDVILSADGTLIGRDGDIPHGDFATSTSGRSRTPRRRAGRGRRTR